MCYHKREKNKKNKTELKTFYKNVICSRASSPVFHITYSRHSILRMLLFFIVACYCGRGLKHNKIKKKSIYFPCERTCPELIQFVRPRKGWIVNEERSPNVKVCHWGKKVSNIGSSQWKPGPKWDRYLFVILLCRAKVPFIVVNTTQPHISVGK